MLAVLQMLNQQVKYELQQITHVRIIGIYGNVSYPHGGSVEWFSGGF